MLRKRGNKMCQAVEKEIKPETADKIIFADSHFAINVKRMVKGFKIEENKLIIELISNIALIYILKGCYFTWIYGKNYFKKTIPTERYVELGFAKVNHEKFEIEFSLPENTTGFGLKYFFNPKRFMNVDYVSREPEVYFPF